MRSLYIKLLLLFSFTISIRAYSQEDISYRQLEIPTKGDILLLDSTINLYKAGNFYISGQPDDSIITALKNQDLGLIINIRTSEEMEVIKKNGFNQEAFLNSINIPYVHIPMGGKVGYTPQAIKAINDAIQLHEGTVMIHCRSAGRATNAWMALLVNYYDIPIDDAISLGKQMQFRLYLEDLLGYELSFGEK